MPFLTAPNPLRNRFNSLDSTMMLNIPAAPPSTPYGTITAASVPPLSQEPEPSRSRPGTSRSGTPTALGTSRPATPSAGGFLAPPGADIGANAGPSSGSDSIALRAIRSVKSLARMGNWGQLGSGDEGVIPAKPKEKEKLKDKRGGDGKKMKKTKEKQPVVRSSGSSFEAGLASPVEDRDRSVGKKASILGLGLGLGLPSTLRRGLSGASSVGARVPSLPDNAGANPHRLSAEGSIISSGSSLRPMSGSSCGSKVSTGSGESGASVKWDEEKLERELQKTRIEREQGREKATKRSSRDSSRFTDGRKRTSVKDLFPEIQAQTRSQTKRGSAGSGMFPILTVEEATSDGHEDEEDEDERRDLVPPPTPLKHARPRPSHDVLSGKSRPAGMYYPEGEGPTEGTFLCFTSFDIVNE
jgi:serine/arginine repetitive matrix protein 2